MALDRISHRFNEIGDIVMCFELGIPQFGVAVDLCRELDNFFDIQHQSQSFVALLSG